MKANDRNSCQQTYFFKDEMKEHSSNRKEMINEEITKPQEGRTRDRQGCGACGRHAPMDSMSYVMTETDYTLCFVLRLNHSLDSWRETCMCTAIFPITYIIDFMSLFHC